jgi:osmotically-inducible protein OsmY
MSTIIDRIRSDYIGDDRLPHPSELAISEREGNVVLRGTVRSFHQRRVAIDIAKQAPGVRAVTDELEVDPRDRWQDAEIRGEALQALVSDPVAPHEQIDVAVTAGWLTLKGQVKRQEDTDAAFAAVSAVPGVGGITNEIRVVTAGGR